MIGLMQLAAVGGIGMIIGASIIMFADDARAAMYAMPWFAISAAFAVVLFVYAGRKS